MATVEQREKLASIMELLVSRRNKIHYAEVRPMRTHWIVNQLELRAALLKPSGITMDCSESVTLLCRLAGLKDPNGLNYDGAGNTQVMFDHLPRYTDPKGAAKGALCFFGIPGELSTQHITMVYSPNGDNPLLFTHGEENDPHFRTLSYMRSGFKGEPHFLSIKNL